jgi:hypothetical protein
MNYRYSSLRGNEKALFNDYETRDYLGVADRDEKRNLTLIHYKEDAKERWNSNFDEEFPFSDFRGLVVDTKKKTVIMKSFGRTPNVIITNDMSPLDKYKEFSMKYEGTIIRVAYRKGWIISTHRKLDCRKSKFGGNKDFNTMFKEACKTHKFNISSLNKNLCYVFIVIHPQNQIIQQNTNFEPYLYHLDTFRLSKYKLFGMRDLVSIYETSNIDIPKPPKMSLEDAKKSIINGYAVVPWSGKKVNFIPIGIHIALVIRGNEPNTFLRWCQLMEEKKQQELVYFVPDYLKKEVLLYPQKIEEQIKKTVKVISDCFNNVPILNHKGYKKSHIEVCNNISSVSEIEKYLRTLTGNKLYQTVVAHTNSHIKSELIYKQKKV